MTRTDPRPLILHVVHRFDVGGLEAGLVNLLNRLPESDWRHAVLALTEVSERFRERVTRRDVEFLALDKPPGHLHGSYPRIFRLMRERGPAIVHTRNLAALEAAVPAWAARVPVRIHGEHGRDARDPDGRVAKLQWVRRAYGPFVTRYVALSGDLERYLVERVGIAPSRVERICNGVDTVRFSPKGQVGGMRSPSPFDERHWVVGTVGRMDPVKNQPLLARAFIRAIELRPAARDRLRLVMVGDGPTRRDVEQLLAAHGVADIVWFAGERSDVPAAMRAMDCFVLPSLGEGISNTILEAMSSGLPVIATRVGGNAELVDDGVTGTLVPSADVESLAHAMLRYVDTPDLAARHGAQGRARVERSFSLAGMIDRYQGLYTQALERAGWVRPRVDSHALGKKAVGS